MKRAIELGKIAKSLGEIPVGAVVVEKSSGKIVGEGYNRRECDKNPIGHAEILAICDAAKNLGGWRLFGCDLYVTLEPCPMCCGAIINSRISGVYFGAFDQKAGSVCSVQEMFSMPYNHSPEYFCGIMQEECGELLSEFFAEIRAKRGKI
ncbi:MAG: nucleoside deaminase [Oscillospiraceae bacterium]